MKLYVLDIYFSNILCISSLYFIFVTLRLDQMEHLWAVVLSVLRG